MPKRHEQIIHVVILFHEIMHSNISIEEGILKCEDGKEAGDLLRMLIACGEVNETKYNVISQFLLDKGLLNKFTTEKN